MGDVARAGRTVVLVSHQLNQIRRLCHRVVWVDDGQIRQNGPTHEVVSAYESAMARGESFNHSDHRGPATKGRFVRWEIAKAAGENSCILDDLEPVTVKFTVDITQSIKNAHYGVALRNFEQQVIWAWATKPLRLEVGERQFCHTFPMLPLRPGPYTWLAALYDEEDLVDWWDCTPEMIVATEVLQHPQEEWKGILNIPAAFEIVGGG